MLEYMYGRGKGTQPEAGLRSSIHCATSKSAYTSKSKNKKDVYYLTSLIEVVLLDDNETDLDFCQMLANGQT